MSITPKMIAKATPTTIDLIHKMTMECSYYPAVDFHSRAYPKPVALVESGRDKPREFKTAEEAYAYAERELAKRQKAAKK